MQFPMDLSSLNPERARLVHVLCETRGFRFYLGAAQSWPDAKAIAAQYKTESRVIFLTDRNDSTRIHGAWNELHALETGATQ